MRPEEKRRIRDQAQVTRDEATAEHGHGKAQRRAIARLASRPEVEIGRKGGLSRSEFKVRAARWNLEKANAERKKRDIRGGRPRKYQNDAERQRAFRNKQKERN